MSMVTLHRTKRSQPDAQALIAEARAHARRRRLKAGVALAVLAAMVTAGVLIGRAVTGTRAVARDRPPPGPLAARTGIVTGHLEACFGLAPSAGGWPVTPGTVYVLRGRLAWESAGPGMQRLVLPKGPAVASKYISDNYDQTFRFALPPGQYVLAGRYGPGPGYAAFKQVTVTAGAVIQADLTNACK